MILYDEVVKRGVKGTGVRMVFLACVNRGWSRDSGEGQRHVGGRRTSIVQ